MQELFSKIGQYLNGFQLSYKTVIEILLLAFLIYELLVWVKNTRTWFLLRGIIVLGIFIIAANLLELNVLIYLSQSLISVLFFAILVIFQPELRNALEQLGQRNYLFRFLETSRSKELEGHYNAKVSEELIRGAFEMGHARTGALIVIERDLKLDEYIKTGIRLDAEVTAELLINIFEKNTPLHDGAVIVRGDRILAATCYLPLSASREIGKELGTRHRAAIGISENSDSVTIVVSEETGAVSLAENGQLTKDLDREALKERLKALELMPKTRGFESLFTRTSAENDEASGRSRSRRKASRKGEKNRPADAAQQPETPAEERQAAHEE